MEAITDLAGLKTRIAYLEQKRENEKDAISEEINHLVESLKPINLIKGLFNSVKKSPDLKSDILHGLIGLGTGFVTNKLLLGKLHGPLKGILGTVLQAGITNAAIRYPDAIKEKGISVLTKFLQSIKFKPDVDHQQMSAESQL
ncbi:MAG TPA: hypothetical protein VK623_00155 [Flavobacterium sp.]|nr:hypothetical protein [Flavobacterium sp.]